MPDSPDWAEEDAKPHLDRRGLGWWTRRWPSTHQVILSSKTMFEFLTFEIWIFQMTTNEETTKTKVVDLEKLYNFVVHHFFIWIHLEYQTPILKSVQHNIKRDKIWVCGPVVGGDARGWGRVFESQLPRSARFSCEKSHDLAARWKKERKSF